MRKGKRKQVGPQRPRTNVPARPAIDPSSAEPQNKPDVKKGGAPKARVDLRAGKEEKVALTIILVLTFLAFANSLDGQFVYDDGFQVQKNPTLRSLGNIPSMFTQSVWQFMNSSPDQPIGLYYRPLFNILLIINYHLFGFNVFGWHFVSLLLHMGATLMVYFLAREWNIPRAGAAVAALLFGIHPVHSESVAWISGVPDPLAAVFILLSLLFFHRYQKAEATGQHWLLLSAILTLLAMLTKEVAIMMPAIVIGIEIVDRVRTKKASELAPTVVRLAIVYGIAAAIYLAMRYQSLGFISKTEPKAVGITTEQVLLTIPSVLLAYGRLMLFPFSLAIVYDHPFVNSATNTQFWAAAIAVIALLALAFWLVRSSRVGQKALILFILFLLPVLNLKAFNPGESIIHDRYLYLPSIGFCILLGVGLFALHQRLAVTREWLIPAFVSLVIVVFFATTVFQNQTWHNDVALAENGIRVSPRKPFLYNFLGAHYSNRKEFGAAEKYYNQAITYDPNYYDALTNQGDVYQQQNKWVEAERVYSRAIAAGAVYSQTYYNLGTVYIQQKKYQDALAPLKTAVQMAPSHAEAHYNLGFVYQQLSQPAEAEKSYRSALEIKPNFLEPRINLASILNQQGRFKESIEQLEMVRNIAPSHPTMLHVLGEAYLKSQRYTEAINVFKQLVGINPQHQFVHTNLGLAYEASGNKEAARASFQKAIEVAPGSPATNVAREHLSRLE